MPGSTAKSTSNTTTISTNHVVWYNVRVSKQSSSSGQTVTVIPRVHMSKDNDSMDDAYKRIPASAFDVKQAVTFKNVQHIWRPVFDAGDVEYYARIWPVWLPKSGATMILQLKGRGKYVWMDEDIIEFTMPKEDDWLAIATVELGSTFSVGMEATTREGGRVYVDKYGKVQYVKPKHWKYKNVQSAPHKLLPQKRLLRGVALTQRAGGKFAKSKTRKEVSWIISPMVALTILDQKEKKEQEKAKKKQSSTSNSTNKMPASRRRQSASSTKRRASSTKRRGSSTLKPASRRRPSIGAMGEPLGKRKKGPDGCIYTVGFKRTKTGAIVRHKTSGKAQKVWLVSSKNTSKACKLKAKRVSGAKKRPIKRRNRK
jgi:hypothetical protein